MDLHKRARELARRTGVRVEHAIALARAGRLGDLLAFERLVDAVLEVEVRCGECAPDQAAARREGIRRALEELAAILPGDDPASADPEQRPPRH